MAIIFGKDALYLPRVTQTHGGAEGIKFNPESINYGLFCITHHNIYYIPKHVLNMERTGWLTSEYQVTKQNVKEYAGMKFEDVVPELAKDIQDPETFDALLTDMANEVKGSCIIPLPEMTEYKIGYFAQFTGFVNQKKFRFAVGGKKKRESLRAFLQEQLGKP